MSDPFRDKPFPKGVLVAAALLIGFSIAVAATARLTGLGTTKMPQGAAVATKDLRFEDRDDGAVVVLAADGDRLVEVIEPGTNGFVRGVLRGLARERKRSDLAQATPFRLTRWADGRLTVEDPSTGRSVDLGAFGPTNFSAFARILDAAEQRS
jgi:putative photosynthetic complex assembly protein